MPGRRVGSSRSVRSSGVAAALALCVLASCLADDRDSELGLGTTADELSAVGPPGTMFTALVPRSTSWRFNSEAIDYGAGGPEWRTADVGVAWRNGDAPLGYGESYIATTTKRSNGDNPATVYFRRAFTVPAGATVRKLYLRVRYDDGFAFYLNGKEGGRAYLPSGTLHYYTLATATREAGTGFATYDISGQIPNLVAGGVNQLAVEVHQSSFGSSDLVFDAELVAWIDRPTPTTWDPRAERGGRWAFWDRGGDLGSAWREPSFDDGAWSVGDGPLGYGEPYIVTDVAAGNITTYFRTHFQHDGSLTSLVAEVRYDDGFVAYLNGHEIARRAMPAGTVTAATLSTGHEGSAYEVLDWSAALPYLVDGDNVLAVEVHQASSTSSDLVFDLSLHPRDGWYPQTSHTGDDLQAIDCFTHQFCWAVGDDGTVVRTRDSGATWRAQDVGVRTDFRAIDLVDGGHGWIVGDGGTVLVTHDTGASWTPVPIDTTGRLVDVQAFNVDPAYAIVLGQGHLWITHDSGGFWTEMALPTGTWSSLRFFDNGVHGWLVGAVPADQDQWAAIYRTDDGGASWTQQWVSGGHFAYLFGVQPTTASTVWAWGEDSLSGAGERKMMTTDGGATWTRAAEAGNSGIYDMRWVGPSLGWGVGYGGTIVATSDGGATWREQVAGQGTGAPSLYGVACGNSQMCWAVGQDGTILATTTANR